MKTNEADQDQSKGMVGMIPNPGFKYCKVFGRYFRFYYMSTEGAQNNCKSKENAPAIIQIFIQQDRCAGSQCAWGMVSQYFLHQIADAVF